MLHDPLYAEYNTQHDIHSIACESCLNMLQSIAKHPTLTLPTPIEKMLAENTFCEFPGEYVDQQKAGSGIFKTFRHPVVVDKATKASQVQRKNNNNTPTKKK